MKALILLLTSSAIAQPFDATTNTIVAPVLGSTYTTTDGTNWTPVEALMIRFDVADTNVPAQRRLRLPVVKAKLDAAVAQSRTNAAVLPFDTNQDDIDKILRHWTVTNTIWHTNYETHPYTNQWITNEIRGDGRGFRYDWQTPKTNNVSRVAQSFSENEVNATWAIRCECGRTMHIAVKTVPPALEIVR